ncbi:uncharacterized protein LOC144135090 [Amblyomma americanum]
MADSRQGGSTDAAAPVHDMEGGDIDDWELLPTLQSSPDEEDGGDSRKEPTSLRGERSHHDGARDELTTRADQGCGNGRSGGGIPSRLQPWAATIDRVVYAGIFGYLPLIAFLHGMWFHKSPRSVSLPTEELQIPVFFVLMSIVHVGAVHILMGTITSWMRQANLGLPFGVFLHIKLLLRLSLFAPAKIGVTMLASGIKVISVQMVDAVTLDAQESYKNCLGNLACLPRTMADLHGLKGHSKEGLLRAGACLYELLSTSKNGELMQLPRDSNGPHMQNFLQSDALGSCLWVFALCVVLLEIGALLKISVDDVAALVALYRRYAKEQCRGATTRRDAFNAASRQCLRRAHYPLVDRLIIWLMGVTKFFTKGPQQPSSQPDPKITNKSPPTAADSC